MASTGVLPFIRGIDLTRNDFRDDKFPKAVEQMTGLHWLRINKTQLEWIPEQLAKLTNLESLSLARNGLVSLHGELAHNLPRLRALICRHNKLKIEGIPSELFSHEELAIVDMSYNNLREIPSELSHARTLLVLNLAHNEIETIPNHMFYNFTELLYLDLSHNQLETLPPQLRRLVSLQVLILNDNPMGSNQLRQLTALSSLQVLKLRNTQRNLQNLPTSLDTLVNLTELDLSFNELTQVPVCVYTLKSLKRLNLSSNLISEISNDIGECWKKMEVLNLSRNRLTALPPSLCKLTQLRRLYVNDNRLDFDGIPSGIGKLANLQVFMASYNNLEMIPEGVVRCGRLKKLVLAHNRLITLPDAIHLLNDLEVLDLTHNPDLILPPKPSSQYPSLPAKKGAGVEFYNVDFSLKHQLQLAGASAANLPLPPSPVAPQPPKDPVARKLRLRRRRDTLEETDSGQSAKVLKGMSDLAKNKQRQNGQNGSFDEATAAQEMNLKPKRWDEALEKPPLDYTDFFDETTGQTPGLTVWEIENFLPNQIDEALHGNFYEGDCYIILLTEVQENQNPTWKIFYWIGKETTLDKKACSAIHAVNLRNYLGAQCRTIREEQGEESEEFHELFPDGIRYIEGGRTPSGFFTVEEPELPHRMYRLHELPEQHRHLHMESVPMSITSLNPQLIFILDLGYTIYVWTGRKAKNTMKQKARLLAEKMNKEERKNKAEITFCSQGKEPDEFWSALKNQGSESFLEEPYANGNGNASFGADLSIDDPTYDGRCNSAFSDAPSDAYSLNSTLRERGDPLNYRPPLPIIYQVKLGMGFLELPQVEYKPGKLNPDLLETKNVYIIDCGADLFVWLGRKSARLVRAAALKLAQEIFSLIKRPSHSLTTRCLEGTEPLILKSKFNKWDDVVAVDFTRTAESVGRTGADLKKWMSGQELKTDLSALFLNRQPPMSKEEANQLIEEWNGDLEKMEGFVLEGRKFVRLPEKEIGHFYNEDCYVFLCHYWVPAELPASEEENPEGVNGEAIDTVDNGDGRKSNLSHRSDSVTEEEGDLRWVVYFWQGRNASNMGWLTFTFSLQKKFESAFKDKLEVIRQHQQQENLRFLAHFRRKFIIHDGKRPTLSNNISLKNDPSPSNNNGIELYHIRANGGPIATRCIQVKAEPRSLNSAFCYLLKVPFQRSEVSVNKPVSSERHSIKEESPESRKMSTTSTSTLSTSKTSSRKCSYANTNGTNESDEDGYGEEEEVENQLSEYSNGRDGGNHNHNECDEDDDDEDDDEEESESHQMEGIIYVWMGDKSTHEDATLAYEIARDKLQTEQQTYTIQLIEEGLEPDLFFWHALGGRDTSYDKEADFMHHLRLFRASNEKGYFSITEKCTDFCQDDLQDDDIMILDDGKHVFLWIGSRCSDVEIKLGLKSAQVYVQSLRCKEPENPRQLMLTFRGKESRKFQRCFHGWSSHKMVKDPRGDERKYLLNMFSG